MVSQHMLSNSSRNLFVPACTPVKDSPQITVHGGRLSSGLCENRRLLRHHSHTTDTWNKNSTQVTSLHAHIRWSPNADELQSCEILHERAVKREQSAGSMVSVCDGTLVLSEEMSSVRSR